MTYDYIGRVPSGCTFSFITSQELEDRVSGPDSEADENTRSLKLHGAVFIEQIGEKLKIRKAVMTAVLLTTMTGN